MIHKEILMLRRLLLLTLFYAPLACFAADHSEEESSRSMSPTHRKVVEYVVDQQEKAEKRTIDFDEYRQSFERFGEFKGLPYKRAKKPLKWTRSELNIITGALLYKAKQNSCILSYKKGFVEFTSRQLTKGFVIPEGATIEIKKSMKDKHARHYDGLISYNDGTQDPMSFKVMVIKLSLDSVSKKKQDKALYQKEVEKQAKSHHRLSITPTQEQAKFEELERQIQEYKEISKEKAKARSSSSAPAPLASSSMAKEEKSLVSEELYDSKRDRKAIKRLQKDNRSKSVTSFQRDQAVLAARGKVLIKQASAKSLKKTQVEKSPSKDGKGENTSHQPN